MSGAVLYLDELAVAYLQPLRLLPKLRAAGFTAVLPPREVQQADRFIQHENLSTQAAAVIESVRKSLADGIASGKVVIAKTSRSGDDIVQDERIKHHPGFAIMEMTSAADAVVVDDRYMNQHREISASFGQRPIYTSYDLLRSFHFTESERTELVTALRRNGFCFVPVAGDDLNRMLSPSLVHDEKVVENAELKALRESLLIARMSDSLQVLKEAPWLDNVMRVLVDAVRLQWKDGVDVVRARARSNWLLELLDIRGWAHRTNPTPQTLNSEVRYRGVVLSLGLAHEIPQSQLASYWEWFEETILRPIKEGDAELYQALIAQVRSHIISAINSGAKDD
jgi:hypothetical protein